MGKTSAERLNNLPQASQPVTGGAGAFTQQSEPRARLLTLKAELPSLDNL